MEDRRSTLESINQKTLDRLSALEVDLAVVKSNYATKEDLAKMEGTLLKWFIGTAVAISSIAFAAARFIH
jgi:predicted fused transcriptional regulator/phosphomethylpyrimidine kinase